MYMDNYLLIAMTLWLHIVYDKRGLSDCLSYFHVSNSALSLTSTTVLSFSILPVFDFFVSIDLTWPLDGINVSEVIEYLVICFFYEQVNELPSHSFLRQPI